MKAFLRIHLLAISFLFSVNTLTSQSEFPSVNLKFGHGLKVTAADSSVQLKMGFRMQSLMVADGTLGDSDSWNSSFMVRRARLKFGGWAVSPKLKYKVEMALSNRDLKSKNDYEQTSQAPKIILDAVLKWQFHKNLELWAGQTKLPGNRERTVSSQKLQFVDRSLVNSIFTLDRDMGFQLRGKFKFGESVLRPMVAISTGEGRNVTLDNVGGYSYTARLEWLPFGKFTKKGDYFASDLYRESSPKLMLGAAYNHNSGASRQKQSGRFLLVEEGVLLTHDLTTVFVDAVLKYNGFSFSSEFAHKEFADLTRISDDGFPSDDAVSANGKSYYTGKGFVAQAGYLTQKNWEVAARFTHVRPDHDMGFKPVDEYTLGVSKYIVGHSLKIQSDVSLIDTDGVADKDLRYRLQFEFAF